MSFWKKNNRNRTLHISDASHPRFRKLNCESLEARNLLSWTGTIRVYLNDMQRLYYEESGVEFRPSENSYRICLQSHWGSGVRFSPVVLRQTIVQD